MSKKVYIFGTSELAPLMHSYLSEQRVPVGGYLIDDEYVGTTELKPIIGWKTFTKTVRPDECRIIVAIGYSKMNDARKRVFEKIINAGYLIDNYIHPSAVVAKGAIIGIGNIVMENVVVQPFARIGNANIFWSNATICHDTTIGDFNFFAASSTILGDCKIGNLCFFGSNSTLKHKRVIADKTLIGAGCFCEIDSKSEDVIVPVRSQKIMKKSKDIII